MEYERGSNWIKYLLKDILRQAKLQNDWELNFVVAVFKDGIEKM